MNAAQTPSLDLAVKVSDLSSASHLRSLLEDQAKPAFLFAGEILPHWLEPVENVPAGTKLTFNLSDNASWKTKTGIGFGLTPTVKCELDVVPSGMVISYLAQVDATTNSCLPAATYAGFCYVKISVSFQIDGNVSGSGTAGAIGIAGNVKGSTAASIVFAHRVANGTTLKSAIQESFEKFVFPFQPGCANDMSAGDLAQVNFHGTFDCNLALSYGIGNYNFAAPSVVTALIRKTLSGTTLSLPSGVAPLGATGTLDYTHSDDFAAIVQKLDTSNAFLYLMRASKNDGSVSVGVAAQINFTGSSSIMVDPGKLEDTFDKLTHGYGAKISAQAKDLEQKLNTKFDDWMHNEVKDGASLKDTWDAQRSTTMLFQYKVNLGTLNLQNNSWQYFCAGNLKSAVGAGGLVLEAGAGVTDQSSRSFTIAVTFFNLFHAADVDKYFQNSSTVVTDTGNLRFHFDVGDENDKDIKGVLSKTRIHFVAAATSDKPADVQLEIELSATKNPQEAGHIAAVARYLSSPQAAAAAKDIQDFISAHSANTLNLNCILDSSAYGKLTCSSYQGNHPPQDQSVDETNWQVFRDAAIQLLNLDYATRLNYSLWQQWNEAATGETIADRRSAGDWNGSGASAIWRESDSGITILLNYFALATQRFMDLCDDLHRLADFLGTAKIPEDWNLLLADLKDIVLTDVNTDFAKPAVAAILKLAGPQNVSYRKTGSGKTLTCELTIA